MNKKILELVYASLNEEQIEIEFHNLLDRIDYNLSIGNIARATDCLLELEFNVQYKRSERKMYVYGLMEKKFFNKMAV